MEQILIKFRVIYILIYFLFIEYTNARSPMDYCNNIESPPQYLINVDRNGMFQFLKNFEYNQTFADVPSVNQDTLFNTIEEFVFLPAVQNGKGLKIS